MKSPYNLIITLLLLIVCLLCAIILFQPNNIIKTPSASITNIDNILKTLKTNQTILSKNTGNVNSTPKNNAKTYYVDQTKGNNSSTGKRIDQPWKDFSNIKKVSFAQGDTILLKRGEIWQEPLFPPPGGTREMPILIDAYGEGPLPLIDVKLKHSAAIRLYHSNIAIKNIAVQNSTNTCIAVSVTGGIKNLLLKNIEIFNAGNNGIGISDGGSDIEINGCHIENAQNNGIYLGGSPQNKLSNVVVNDCHIVNALGNDGVTIHEDGEGNSAGSNFLLKNNVAEMCAEQGFDITTGENVLLLNNRTNMNKQGGVVVGHSAQNITIKRHISSDEPTENTSAAINLGGSHGNIRLTQSIIKGFGYHLLAIRASNVAVYNNNFIWDGGSAPIDISGKIENIYFMNNIVYSKQNRMDRIRFLEPSRPINYPGFHFDYNIYHTPGNDVIFYSDNKNFNLKKIQTLFKVESHSLNINPAFVNSTKNEFALEKNSPAIDQGSFYTHTLSQPEKNKFIVHNALFFYKGFGADTLQCIKFKDTKTTFNIAGVNYSDNTISLNEDITTNQNHKLGFCFDDSGIDIGAYEFQAVSSSSDE